MNTDIVYAAKPLQEALNKYLPDSHVIIALKNHTTVQVAMTTAHTKLNEAGYKCTKVKGVDALTVQMPKGMRRITFFIAQTRNRIHWLLDNLAKDPDVAGQRLVLVASQKIPLFDEGHIQPVQ